MIKQSHHDYRKELKKQRRKGKRKLFALEHEQFVEIENDCDKIDKETEIKNNLLHETERLKRHELWLEAEKQAVAEIQHQKLKRENEIKRQEEQQRKIREEWEEQQKKDKEEEERRAKDKEERDKKVDLLLKEATINEKNDEANSEWHNPIYNEHTRKEILRECCPFFKKTGACRFGQYCSRAHLYPDCSKVIMFPGMFTSFMLEQGLQDEYDADIGLEYEDSEIQQHFCEFYDDVLPEFKTVGRVIQFKVCCNFEPHLRGNVYVAYCDEEDTKNAFIKFNGRFYGGKCLSPMFIDITSWKAAICGLFGRNKCPKGKNCNFLHVFRNPRNEFWYADIDRSESTDRDNKHRYNNRHLHRDRSRSRRSRSRSISERRSHRHRSHRSRDSRSLSNSRSSRSRNHASKSPSKSRNRSNSRSPSRTTKTYLRRKSRSKSRDRSAIESSLNSDISDKDDINSPRRKRSHKSKHKKHSKKEH